MRERGIVILFISFALSHNMVLYKIPRWIQKIFPSVLWRVETSDQAVYLTFDDGPNPEITLWVLDLLDQYQAKATFFCVGRQLAKHPDMRNELKSRGHEVGSHTFSHADAYKISTDDYLQEVSQGAKAAGSALFRPPYGHLTPWLYIKLKKKYRIVLWDVMAYDFTSTYDVNALLAELKKNTTPGSIVVFHDNAKAAPQLKIILPQYLQWLKEKGFSCYKIF